MYLGNSLLRRGYFSITASFIGIPSGGLCGCGGGNLGKANNYTLGTRGFSRVRREFSVLAEATSGEAARKTSGTERCFLPSPLTFALFYRITFTPIRLKVSNCDHVARHMKRSVQRPTLSLAKQVRV